MIRKHVGNVDYNFDGFGDESNEELELYVVLQVVMQELYALCVVAYIVIEIVLKRYIHKYPRTVIPGPNRLQEQMDHINGLVRESNITCIEQICMDRCCFMTLCHMVHTIGGLGHSKHNFLGALDGTYIKVRVPVVYQARYRTQKGEIATNVLGVCSQDMNFIYVSLGWERLAADSRILRDAINQPNGLRIPTGYYYLVDAKYTNDKDS
ncbi:hypothetical protein CsSME_00019885 [Camellia sinensis var. sinensis]